MDYKGTLNLPKTEFSMQAGLPKREPAMLESWEKNKTYETLIEKNAGKPLYVLHDGPPYANGNIHLGTALNKVLKDMIVRYKNMSGYQAPYVPGWDTHGLPTELKARKKAGVDNSTTISDVELRRICRETALEYLNDQRTQFKRLGVLGEWDNPYITLQKEFEAVQIELFSEIATKGYIYRGLKPVYWCADCETALAEAEIEYMEDPCDSIYVKFRVTEDQGIFAALGIDPAAVSFVIWTTTTWTLPGNLAIALGPTFEYGLYRAGDEYYVMATALAGVAMQNAGIAEPVLVEKFIGAELERIRTAHPFLPRESLVIVGDHVTLESGTGCVHTAPGHGVEDYDVCRNHYPELKIVVPVDAHGKMTAEAGKYAGLTTQKANAEIVSDLKAAGALFAIEKITHQYPHCWRCKHPIIYRATEQWFCSVDAIKEKAIAAIREVEWLPGWGEERITNMVRDRSDWCISRQRRWGVPIPIFYCNQCGEPLISGEVMAHIAKLFRQEGSDAWYARPEAALLPAGVSCAKCGHDTFTKELDIMDVWFDSGSSHAAVCAVRDYLHWPADMYLEGADQYRGWFQSSLLTSVAWRGVAPYRTVVTHGWVVDGEGRKMSKSLGNGILPEEIVEQHGADILRLWVASADYHADIRISKEILKQLSDAYRKIRNTARFMLGNLSDFDPNRDSVAEEALLPIDRWARYAFNELVKKARHGYEKHEFHQVYHALHNFCVTDMSNFYLDVIKDRLYVEKSGSPQRRAAQTVMFAILDGMTRLLSPILAFTGDEIWHVMPHRTGDNPENVVFNEMPQEINFSGEQSFIADWNRIHEIRDDVKKALELARAEKVIGASLDAKVTLYCADDTLYDFAKSVEAELGKAFIVSQIAVEKGGEGEFTGEVAYLSVTVARAAGEKCARCWSYSDTIGAEEAYPDICARCASCLE